MSRPVCDSGKHGDAAVVGFGARDQFIRGAQALVPARRRRPAVVDHEQQRRAAARGGDRRIPQRSGGGDDHQRGQRQAQQDQPPGRARRRLFLGRDLEQQARRREIDLLRPRRHEPQQPPQHRQAQQAEQDQRLGEAERKAHHVGASVPVRAGWRLLTTTWAPAPMRAWIANNSSVGPRSVRCTVKLQPNCSHSARKAAR